jgi:hypothetical protein
MISVAIYQSANHDATVTDPQPLISTPVAGGASSPLSRKPVTIQFSRQPLDRARLSLNRSWKTLHVSPAQRGFVRQRLRPLNSKLWIDRFCYKRAVEYFDMHLVFVTNRYVVECSPRGQFLLFDGQMTKGLCMANRWIRHTAARLCRDLLARSECQVCLENSDMQRYTCRCKFGAHVPSG